MTLRDEFEKLCPVPDGVHRSKIIDDCYAFDFGADLSLVNHYNSKYQGFLLGRRNTVSVCRCGDLPRLTSKERDHRDCYCVFCMSCEEATNWHRSDEDAIAAWNKSQAKRRTEEV